MMEKIANIQGMSCNNCANTVERKLSDLEGLDQVSVSHEDGQARFHTEEDVSKEALNQALEDTPYHVIEVQ